MDFFSLGEGDLLFFVVASKYILKVKKYSPVDNVFPQGHP